MIALGAAFVSCSSGINPGVRSAAIGHHFAGYSNRFWKLLCDASLVPEPIGTEDDYRLPEWGSASPTSSRVPTPGIDTLRFEEYEAGLRVLRRKVRRWKPKIVALWVSPYFDSSLRGRLRLGSGLGFRLSVSKAPRVFVLTEPQWPQRELLVRGDAHRVSLPCDFPPRCNASARTTRRSAPTNAKSR